MDKVILIKLIRMIAGFVGLNRQKIRVVFLPDVKCIKLFGGDVIVAEWWNKRVTAEVANKRMFSQLVHSSFA